MAAHRQIALTTLPSLRTPTCPTLVIWGMNDTALLPGNLEGLDQWVTRFRQYFEAQPTFGEHLASIVEQYLATDQRPDLARWIGAPR